MLGVKLIRRELHFKSQNLKFSLWQRGPFFISVKKFAVISVPLHDLQTARSKTARNLACMIFNVKICQIKSLICITGMVIHNK